MERKIEISYSWDLSEYPNISHEKKEMLSAEAERRIYEMRKEWYTSGELNFEDGEISVRGWWDFREINA